MSVITIPLPYVITIKYKILKRPDQNIRFYLYLASFSLLLFIFLIRFSLSLSFFLSLLFIFLTRFSLFLSCSSSSSSGSLSLSSFSLRPSRSSSSSWPWRYSLSYLSLYSCGGPLSLLFLSLFVWLVFLICTVLIFFFLGFQSVQY
jgi:hypothetical protein